MVRPCRYGLAALPDGSPPCAPCACGDANLHPEGGALLLQPLELGDGRGHGREQLGRRNRLADHPEYLRPDALADFIRRVELECGVDDHHRRRRIDLLQQGYTVELRQVQIQDEHIDVPVAEDLECDLPVLGLHCLVALEPEDHLQRLTHRRLVLDDEHRTHRAGTGTVCGLTTGRFPVPYGPQMRWWFVCVL